MSTGLSCAFHIFSAEVENCCQLPAILYLHTVGDYHRNDFFSKHPPVCNKTCVPTHQVQPMHRRTFTLNSGRRGTITVDQEPASLSWIHGVQHENSWAVLAHCKAKHKYLDLVRLNVKTGQTEALSATRHFRPTCRFGAAVAAREGVVFVFGGYDFVGNAGANDASNPLLDRETRIRQRNNECTDYDCRLPVGDLFMVESDKGAEWRMLYNKEGNPSPAVKRFWESRSPSARAFASLTSTQYGLLLFGGENADRQALDDGWFLNVGSFDWQQTLSRPPARCLHSACWIRDQGVIIRGGQNQAESELLDDMWLLPMFKGAKVTNIKWQPLQSTGADPGKAERESMMPLNSRSVLFVGVVGGELTARHLDTTTWHWTDITTLLPPPPPPLTQYVAMCLSMEAVLPQATLNLLVAGEEISVLMDSFELGVQWTFTTTDVVQAMRGAYAADKAIATTTTTSVGTLTTFPVHFDD